MGPNHSFHRFIKNMLRDSPKVRHIKNLLSFSSSLKKKGYSPVMVGEKLKRESHCVYIHFWQQSIESSSNLALVVDSLPYNWVIHCLWVIQLLWVFIPPRLVTYPIVICKCYVPHYVSSSKSIFCRAYWFEDHLPRVYHSQSCVPRFQHCTYVNPTLLIPWYHLTPMSHCWWGIHHFPPSTSLFLLTSTHHMRIRMRTYSVPWNSHASMVGILIFDSGFTSLTSDQKIPRMFDFNSFIHISLECTTIPWGSSSLLAISLTLLNSIH